MRTKGYSQLKFDVSSVVVPDRWSDYSYEYRHGYGKGLERDGVYNPIPGRSLAGDDARQAWFVGYADGKKARKVAV